VAGVQCLTGAAAGSAAVGAAATTGTSSFKGSGIRSRAISSTLSIHLTGTISRPFFTFSGIS